MCGRLTNGAEPTAISRFWTSAQCSISSAEMARITDRQRSTASSCAAVNPGPASERRLKAANRYCAIRLCSSSAACESRYVSSLRCSTTIPCSSPTAENVGRLQLRFSEKDRDRAAATFRGMAVPLPTDAEVNHNPPEADEVRIIAQGVMGAVAPETGLTDLQRVLIRAIVHSMTGHIVEPDQLEPIGPEAVAVGLRHRDRQFRTRIVQVMALAELILVPLPDE